MSGEKWTWQEESWLREKYADTDIKVLMKVLGFSARRIHQKAHQLDLKKSPQMKQFYAKANPQFGANRHSFQPGSTPWNKGVSYKAGGRSAETQFKPGNMPHNTLEVGSIIADTDGYLKVKVAEPNRWKFLHRKTWEDANGPIPKGHAVIFRDGNRKNCALENLELVSRGELANRNHIPAWKHYPEELKETIHLHNALKTTLRERRKHEKQPD